MLSSRSTRPCRGWAGSSTENKRISVKIFLRLISPPCAHSWPLFLLTKTYKGSLYLLVTLEKSLDIIFALFFLLESSKLCPVCKPPFCLAWPHPLYVKGWLLRLVISPIQRV